MTFLWGFILALASTGVWEVRGGTGDDNNSGYFNSAAAGTDRSQQASAQVVINNSTIVCSTPSANSNTLTFDSGYTPTSADVGNGVMITGGTNVNTGLYEITAQTSTTWTVTGAQNLTTSGGAGSAITGNMGGALATPGRVGQFKVNDNTVHIKSATYTISSSSNVAGGRITDVTNSNAGKWIGYQTTRNDGGTKPVLNANAASMTVFTGAQNTWLENIEIDNSGANASVTGFSVGAARPKVINCKFRRCTTIGCSIGNAADALVRGCEGTGCSGTAAFQFAAGSLCKVIGCTAYDNTITGFKATGATVTFINCISDSNSGAGSEGFEITNDGTVCMFCVAYNNGSDGFQAASGAENTQFINCISMSNGGYGYNAIAAEVDLFLNKCAAYNNTSGTYNGNFDTGKVEGFITLTADPFTDAAGGNFALNNTAGGGANCRAVGYPTSFSGLSTTNYQDIGAAQHQDSPGSSGAVIVRRNVVSQQIICQ